MDAPAHPATVAAERGLVKTKLSPGLPAVILLGVVYLLVGITFGTLAGRAASHQTQVAWRLGAWLVSAAAFAGHIGYEQFRLRTSRRKTALHVALCAALGAFGLAVAATVHAQLAGASNQRAFAIALVAWPVLCGLPAFVVALAAAAALGLTRGTAGESPHDRRSGGAA